MLDRFRSDLT